MPNYQLKDDFADHLSSAVPITLYHSQDDDVIPFSHCITYQEKIPQATPRKLDGYGHFLEVNAIPELIADIRRLD